MSILLTGKHGDRFGLHVSGYEFPHITEHADANWVMLVIEARNRLGHWICERSCWQTSDLIRFAEWWREMEKGSPSLDWFTGYEPDLMLQHIETTQGGSVLRVYFEYGMRPEWKPQIAPEMKYDLFSTVHVSRAECRECAEIVEGYGALYPPRGEWGQRWLQYHAERSRTRSPIPPA